MRETKKSVTCFLQCGDEYLFVHRTKKGNDTDANRLNGIGGKLEKGENFLEAALRETAEETGYVVVENDCHLAGVVNLEGGYDQDWNMCFFVISVDSKNIPLGSSNAEGELLWLHKDNVLNSSYVLVDDLHYLWQKIIAQNSIFFAGTVMDEKEKVDKISVSEILN
jgi:8-oxo-dGTP diphosphatase